MKREKTTKEQLFDIERKLIYLFLKEENNRKRMLGLFIRAVETPGVQK